MANIIYMKEGHLDDLRSHISANLHYYCQTEPWLDNFFKKGAWNLQSKISIDDVKLVLPKGSGEHFDFENTKIIYTALKDLSLTQASDERLWASLSHFRFWEYMHKRWPVGEWLENPRTNKRINDLIRERYFLLANRSRGLIRNGISRLWWYGYVSYDETRSDPFELTRILLKTLDVAESLLGRSFSHNANIVKPALAVLAEFESKGTPFMKRERFRDLMKYINQIGGVTLLDTLSQSDIKQMLEAKIKQLMPQTG